MPMQCQEEHLPGQILQKHVMQCWFLPVLCQSQGINNCYNHCPSTFADPGFILINWWIIGSNHIVILIDFLHPRVTWNLFPQSELDTSSKADVYPRPFTWRTALPSGVRMSISVGILLVILIDSPISPSISPGISMDFRRFPGARQRLAMLSFRTGRSLNSTETVRLKLCEFTNLYEL